MPRLMVRNHYESTTPCVIHANGMEKSVFWRTIRKQSEMCGMRLCCDHGMDQSWTDAMTLVSVNTIGKESALAVSCKQLGLPLLEIRGEQPKPSPGDRVTYELKIKRFANALEQIKTKFVMAVDSFDAIMLESPGRALDVLLKNYGDDAALFGAEKGHFPDYLDTKDAEYAKAAKANRERKPYLNSGCIIGSTERLKKIYAKAEEVGENWLQKGGRTDQAILKVIYSDDMVDGMFLDYDSRVVTNLYKVRPGEIDMFWVDGGICMESLS